MKIGLCQIYIKDVRKDHHPGLGCVSLGEQDKDPSWAPDYTALPHMGPFEPQTDRLIFLSNCIPRGYGALLRFGLPADDGVLLICWDLHSLFW